MVTRGGATEKDMSITSHGIQRKTCQLQLMGGATEKDMSIRTCQ
jgi:hypothetical protein